MKRVKLTIFISFLLVGSPSFAQQLERVYQGNNVCSWCYNYQNLNYIKYLIISSTTKSDIIYNFYSPEDLSFTNPTKQIRFNATTSQNENIIRSNLETYTSNFIFVAIEDTTKDYWDNEHESLKMFDTKGDLLYDFGYGCQIQYFTSLVISADKLLIGVNRQIIDDDQTREWYYELYTITTPLENSVQNIQVERKAIFPCPAREVVNIPTSNQQGMLQVLNMNGQMMHSQGIQDGEYQTINTSSYPAGTYIYQSGNETGKFIVQ